MRSVIVALILLIGSNSFAADPHKFTKANFAQIKRGMGEGYVLVLLGRPDAVTFKSGPYKHVAWFVGNDYEDYEKIIHVYFKNDKVTGKLSSGL